MMSEKISTEKHDYYSIPDEKSMMATNDSRYPFDRTMSTQSLPKELMLRHGTMQSTKSYHSNRPEDLQIEPEQKLQQEQRSISELTTSSNASIDAVMGVANSIHNLPRLYGDRTVRENKKVTGIVSGLKEAGKEFGYGFYDGFSGLVTMPIRGAAESGPSGAAKGFVQGSIGVLVKPAIAFTGLAAFTAKGLHKEYEKRSIKIQATEASNSSSSSRSASASTSTTSFECHSVRKISGPRSPPAEVVERETRTKSPSVQVIEQEMPRNIQYRQSQDTIRSFELDSVYPIEKQESRAVSQPPRTSSPQPQTQSQSSRTEKREPQPEAQDEHTENLPPYEEIDSLSGGTAPTPTGPSPDYDFDNCTVYHSAASSYRDDCATPTAERHEDRRDNYVEENEEGGRNNRESFVIRDSVAVVTDERYSAVLGEGRPVVFSRGRSGGSRER